MILFRIVKKAAFKMIAFIFKMLKNVFTNKKYRSALLYAFFFALVVFILYLIREASFTIPQPPVPDYKKTLDELNVHDKNFLESTVGKKYALISLNIDSNPGYFYHLPILALMWRRVNFEPFFIIVYSDQSKLSKANNLTLSYLEQMNVKVHYFHAVENYEITTAMVVREMSGLLGTEDIKENDFILTSDCDLYPIDARHYVIVNDDAIKVWNYGCCGDFSYNGEVYSMLPMAHIGMRKYQWHEVMGIDPLVDQMDGQTALKLIKKFNGEARENSRIVKGDDYWYVDQKMVSVYVDR
jgi:hypothetical protein